jgi:hypothetical protein
LSSALQPPLRNRGASHYDAVATAGEEHWGRLRSTDTGYRNRQFGYAQIRKWHA